MRQFLRKIFFLLQAIYEIRNFSITDKFVISPLPATFKTELKFLAKLDGRNTNVWGASMKFIGEYKTEPRSV